MTDPLHRVIDRLEELGRHGRGASWQCPAHNDLNPSLRIARGENGGVLLHCHAGCSVESVLNALGLTWPDLFEEQTTSRPRPDLAMLLYQHRAGELHPARILLGDMPDDATADMRRIAEDMQLLLGLHAAAGEHRPMPYSARFAAERMGWPSGHMRASRAIRRLVAAGVIERVGDLPARGGQQRGTALYAPPVACRGLVLQETCDYKRRGEWEGKHVSCSTAGTTELRIVTRPAHVSCSRSPYVSCNNVLEEPQ